MSRIELVLESSDDNNIFFGGDLVLKVDGKEIKGINFFELSCEDPNEVVTWSWGLK